MKVSLMIKKYFESSIFEAQELLNKEYKKNGLTDEILEEQIKLNGIRNILDIHDVIEEIYEGFVQ